jgi:hypothetical protein
MKEKPLNLEFVFTWHDSTGTEATVNEDQIIIWRLY